MYTLGTKHLERLGISVLTGESCAYTLRLLCDVSPMGKRMLEKFFGVKELVLSSNWNWSLINGQAPIGSIMLAQESLRAFIVFGAFELEPAITEVWVHPGGSIDGITVEDLAEWKSYESFDEFRSKLVAIYTRGLGNTRNGRNVHAMSGRAE